MHLRTSSTTSIRHRKSQRMSHELQVLATQLRNNVEIRDRKYHLKNYKSCFLGTEAVDWMVSSKWAKTRQDAVRKGRLLVRYRYIHHVVNNHDFSDSALFFRFYADESKRSSYKFWAERTAEEAAADPRMWRFEPHTVANSLVLSVQLATALENAVASTLRPRIRQVFGVVRQRVLNCVVTKDVWVKSARLSGDGVSVYRQQADSAYPAIKTEFELETSAAELQRALLDLRTRCQLEPYVQEVLKVGSIVAMEDPSCRIHHEKAAKPDTTGSSGPMALFDPAPGTGSRVSSLSRSTTPPPRMPSSSGTRRPMQPLSVAAPPPPPPLAATMASPAVQPRRSRAADEEAESDSDEELLSDKLSRFVHGSRFLSKMLGGLVSKPSRPTLDAAMLRSNSIEDDRRPTPVSVPSASSGASSATGPASGGSGGSGRGGVAGPSPRATGAGGAGAGAGAGSADAAADGTGGDLVKPAFASGSPVASNDDATGTGSLPAGARILYRRCGAVSSWMNRRDYCVVQDFFQLADGRRVVYEMSVQHRSVPPAERYVRGEIMLLAYVLTPVKAEGEGETETEAEAGASTVAAGEDGAPAAEVDGSGTPAAATPTPDTTATDGAAAGAGTASAEGEAGSGVAADEPVGDGAAPPAVPPAADAGTTEAVAAEASSGASAEAAATTGAAASGKPETGTEETPKKEKKKKDRVNVTIISHFDPHINVGALSRFVVGSTLVDYQSRWIVDKARSMFEPEEEETSVPLLEGVVPKDRYDDGEAGAGAGATDDASTKVGLSSFDLLAVLGRGGYGKVMMVRHKETSAIFAMKVLRKKDLVARKQVGRTMVERAILSNVSHPFIVGLQFAFQTPAKLYMVIDFVSGGDFFTLLTREGCVNNRRAQLYMAELCLALNHLHKRGIVYRDLKPENVLLDGDGHVMLTDFGLSRLFEKPVDIDMSSEGKTEEDDGALKVSHSFCGTEQYMAPEVLLQRGHNHTVDYWCLGILLSEMLTGRHPFKGKQHMQTLRNIVNPSVRPSTTRLMKPAAASFMRGLLQRDSKHRLGSEEMGGFDAVKAHPFFAGLDWDAVFKRAVTPEFVPRVSGTDDTSNFDRVFTREAPVDSRTSMDAPSGSGLFGLFGGKKKSSSPKRRGIKTDDGFRGFSYVAPGLLEPGTAEHELTTTLAEEERVGRERLSEEAEATA